MLALVPPRQEPDSDAVTGASFEDLVQGLARLLAAPVWDGEVDGQARAIVADLYEASMSGHPDAGHRGAFADPVADRAPHVSPFSA